MATAFNSLGTPTAEQFIDEFVAVLRARSPRGEIAIDRDEMSVHSAGTTFFLASTYRRYCRCWPWQRRRLLERQVAMADEPLDAGRTDWADVQGIIVPTVRDRFSVQAIHYVDEAEGRAARMIPQRVLTDRLCVTLALDLGDRFALVTSPMLESWRQAFDDAEAAAVANLRRESGDDVRSVVQDRIFEGRWGDGNCASRLLLDDTIRGLPLRGPAAFVVPDRASFLVTGADDDDGLAALLRFLDSVEEVDQPVSRIPVVRRWPGFESMALPATHPLYPALRRQMLRDWGDIYRDQHDLLRRVLARRGDPAHLGPYLLYQPDDPHEAPQSFTTWSPGAATLLPEVDQIAFVDPDRPEGQEVVGMVDWQRVAERLPLEAGRTGDYPSRYRVSGFPQESLLEELVGACSEAAPTKARPPMGADA